MRCETRLPHPACPNRGIIDGALGAGVGVGQARTGAQVPPCSFWIWTISRASTTAWDIRQVTRLLVEIRGAFGVVREALRTRSRGSGETSFAVDGATSVVHEGGRVRPGDADPRGAAGSVCARRPTPCSFPSCKRRRSYSNSRHHEGRSGPAPRPPIPPCYRAIAHRRIRCPPLGPSSNNEMHTEAMERLQLDSRLRQALEHNEFELDYQTASLDARKIAPLAPRR